MILSVDKCKEAVESFLPWGEHLARVFLGCTFAVHQTWRRKDGNVVNVVKAAVPASWFYHRKRIETQTDFMLFTAQHAAQHILGFGPNRQHRWEAFRVGIYPLLSDNTVRFVAADLDLHQKKGESDTDFSARRLQGFPALLSLACEVPSIAARYGVPISIEISGSGSGIHIWLFFSESVPASQARRLLWRILQVSGVAKTMLKGLPGGAKFDCLFPKQDRIVGTSPGNLIFLPYYQFGLRAACETVIPKSIFIDHDFIEKYGYENGGELPTLLLKLSTWLDGLERMSAADVTESLATLGAEGFNDDPPSKKLAESAGESEKAPWIPDAPGIDWSRFLKRSGIRFTERRNGIFHLTDGCPYCGDLSHNAWVNSSGYLHCWGSDCAASTDNGGVSATEWCRAYKIASPYK